MDTFLGGDGEPPTQLVGRQSEFGDLASLANQVQTRRQGRLVIVSGDAGIGKSALCAEVAAALRRQGHTVVQRACWPGTELPAMWVWSDVMAGLSIETDDGEQAGEPFVRAARLVEHLETMSRRQPVAVFIDDMHLADRESLVIGRFLARALPRMALFVVATWRGSGPPDHPDAVGFWNEAHSTVHLDPLSTPAMDDLLDQHTALDDPQRERCRQLSGGNPLYLHELIQAVRRSPDHLAATAQQVIGNQLDALTPDVRAMVQAAAILGPQAPTGDVAAVTDSTPLAVADLDAVASGLIRIERHRVLFRHDTVREAVAETVDADTTASLHRRMATRLADATDLPSVRSRVEHALGAAPASRTDLTLAIGEARRLAAGLVEANEYSQAATILDRLIEVVEGHGVEVDADLRVEQAEAVLRSGRLAEARTRFARAADAAEATDDPVLMARAALGLGGVWLEEHRTAPERERLDHLLRRCMDALADTDNDHQVLCARLETRQAAERFYQDQASLTDIDVAVERVRNTGDDGALAEALSLLHHALLTPDQAHRRLAVAEELIAVSSRERDGLHHLIGTCWRTVDLFLAGDRRADSSLAEFAEHAAAMGCASLEYIVAVLEAMQLFRWGRLTEAEQRTTEALAFGEAVGDDDSLAYYGGQLVALRWAQGRAGELRPMLEDLANSPTLKTLDTVFPAVCAGAAAADGDERSARRWLDRIGVGALHEIPLFSTWTTAMFSLVETAWLLSDRALAAELRPLLEPYRDHPVRASLAVTCLGPTTRLLALLHATIGDVEDAVDELRTALRDCRRLDNRPVSAIISAEMAAVLQMRSAPGDRSEAAALLRIAVEEANAMGLDGRARAWQAQLDDLTSATPELPAGQAGPKTDPSGDVIDVVRVASGWEIRADDRTVVLGDSVGMRHLTILLANPERTYRATELSEGTNVGSVRGNP